MKSQSLPWSRGAVFICEKCGKREDGPKTEKGADIGTAMRMELRSVLKHEGLQNEIRVMNSGCMGLCPDGKQVLAYMPAQGEPQVLTMDPATESDQLEKWVLTGFPKS